MADWLENDYAEVDKPRMVMEMQRSGLSKMGINPLTRSLWSFNLNEALEPPELGDRVVVLDFEWIVKDKEARAVVATFTTYNSDSYVYVLYLKRSDGDWKLFDWRDVLQPMSEAQYWAIYAGLIEPLDEAHLNFSDTAYEIYTSESPTADKIKQTVAAYKRAKFPRRFNAMAQDTLCSWLVLYNAKDELAEYSKQLSPDDFAGALLYKARSAAWANDIELAFQHLRALNKQVGWHPEVGRMAVEYAETVEQKQLAVKWLEREVQLAPINTSTLQSFLELADRQQVTALFQNIAKSKEPDTAAIELIESLYYMDQRQIQYFLEILQPIAKLQQAKQYLEFKLAAAKDDYDKVLTLAPAVLQLDSLTVDNDSPTTSILWGAYLNAAVQTNAFTRAFEETPDRDRLLSELQEFVIYNDDDLLPAEALALLKSIPVDHELNENKETQIAIASMEIKQGNASGAFDLLFAVYKENESQIESEESIPLFHSFLSTLATAALKSERWRELTEVLSPEEMLLLLGWSSDLSSDQNKQVLEWYEGLENQPAYWPNYFRARAAFDNGDWSSADRSLVDAIRLAKQDERSTDEVYSTMVGFLIDIYESEGFDRYESDLATYWLGLRISYAARCNELDRLVAQAQVADELDEKCVEKIAEYYSEASIESREKLASILQASPLESAQSLASEIRASLLIPRGQFAQAFEDQIKRAREQTRDSYEQRSFLNTAGKQLLLSGDRRLVEPLKQASRGTDMQAYVDCVSATLERDIPALCSAIKRWDEVDWNYQQFVDVTVLYRLQGVQDLRKVFDTRPFDLDGLVASNEVYQLVLSEEPLLAAKAFEEFLKSKGLNHQILDATRFDQASAAIELKTEDGDFVFAFNPADQKAFIASPLTETFAKEARTIVMCSAKNTGQGQYEARRNTQRTQLNGVLGGLASASALYDAQSLSLFYGAGWQERFGQSVQTGVDLAHPQQCYAILANSEAKSFLERDGQSYVAIGEARELIPVKLQPQASPWLGELAVTLAPSILVPCLAEDAVVKIERD